jgi:DNA invertase Pin-like site-specific DNA recombinase
VTAAKAAIRRCAIYTRKSSEEGLEQAFNSLHAQREACEAFIRSQQGEGWRVVETAYDDGGLSGGTMDRPALRRLLADIGERRIDTVVVYKVDRLTRSLMDFSKMVELFDRHEVSFVAVTQQFNTTTSMGRLTLNILLSFAQFEREVTGERIRDKIGASKKKGMWMGGVTPLGYEIKHRKLVIDPTEAETVRLIYRRYMELGSVRELRNELDTKGIRSKVRTYQDGSKAGGCRFARGSLYALLSNPIYIGEISHKGARYPGQHQAILDRATWDAVQQRLDDHHNGGPGPVRKVAASPLMGKLFEEGGGRISPSHALKAGRRYRYYVSRSLVTGTAKDTDLGWRLPAPQIEKIVALEAAKMLSERGAIAAALEQAGLAPGRIPAALASAQDYCGRLRSETELSEGLASLIQRVDLRPDQIAITITLAPLVATIEGAGFPADELTLMREVPLRIKRRGVEMRLIIEGERAPTTKADPTLMKEIKRAHRCFDALLTGRASIAELAEREGVDDRYVSTVLPLAFLSPDIVEAIVGGTQPADLNATTLIRRVELALDWDDQKRQLGFA